MALANKIDTEQARANLEGWLEGQLAGAEDVRVSGVSIPQASGLSNETVMFDAGWTENGEERSQPMVARVAPDGEGIFPSYDLDKEARVMAALAEGTDVRAPAALFTCDDPSVLGAPFLVMERVVGEVPSDDPPFTAAGWVLELSDAQRSTLAENALEQLVAVHAADWRGLGLEFLDSAENASGLDGQLAYWRTFFAWAADGEANPTVEAALAWLDEHKPADVGPDVLLWGDARYGNLLFADDLSVAGVLDWEMVAVGPAEIDVAWWQFLLRHHTEGIGAPIPGGIPPFEATVARYEQLSGSEVRDLEYFEILAGTRLAIIMVRAASMMKAAGMLGEDSTMALNNPASQLLGGLLGLDALEGESTSFIGNR